MSNCFIFAFSNWIKHGGYLALRKSRHGFWMHFVWIKDLKDAEVYQYRPEKLLKYPLVSKLLFKGKVIDHDKAR